MSLNKNETSLNLFRTEIDKIDSDIIKLLKQRMQVISRVAQFKKSVGEKFFIKSAREADMVKDLIAQFPDFPASAISKIWRAIITSANLHEQPISALIYNPKNLPDYKYLVREYYLNILPIFEFKNFVQIIENLEKKPAQIVAFPASEASLEDWWIDFAKNKIGLKIFAKIKNNFEHELFLSAIKQQEKSSADKSLLVIEIEKGDHLNAVALMENNKIPAKILASKNEIYLLELDGFYDNEDRRFDNFKKTCTIFSIIGNYPN